MISPLEIAAVYSRRLFGKAEPELESLAGRDYFLHVLCSPDIPFHQDGTRRNAEFRQEQDAWYRTELHRRRVDWIEVRGTLSDRVSQVVDRII